MRAAGVRLRINMAEDRLDIRIIPEHSLQHSVDFEGAEETQPVEGHLSGNEREAFKKLMKLVGETFLTGSEIGCTIDEKRFVSETGAILNEFTYMHSEEPAPEGDKGKAEEPPMEGIAQTGGHATVADFQNADKKRLPVDDGTLTADLAQVTTDLMTLMQLVKELGTKEVPAVLTPRKCTVADWHRRARQVVDSYWISEEEWSRVRKDVAVPPDVTIQRMPYVLTGGSFAASHTTQRNVELPEVFLDLEKQIHEIHKIPEARTEAALPIIIKYKDAELIEDNGRTGPRPSKED